MIIKDGKEYARVSDVLKPFSDFSHIDEAVLARKCMIGTLVHEAIAQDIQGNFPILDEDGWGYFKSYMKWAEHMECDFVQSEKRYFDDEYMLTGQIDALISYGKEDTPVLVDFKTSASEGKVWTMQAHLYSYLLIKNDVHHQSRFLFVKLDKKGALPTVFEYKFNKNTAVKSLQAIHMYWKVRKSDSNLIASKA